jgi:antitoxin (DNA-binding transcriptional repressor) of toxin-antitoxin stability system
VVITRHGRAVARLLPVEPPADQQRAEAVARLRAFRTGKQLNGLSLRSLRDEGRKR